MIKMSGEQHQLFIVIDDLLWNEWDPIGMKDVLPRYEYESYVPQIFNLTVKNATVEEIAQELSRIETQTIGVEGNLEKCRQVANMIVTKREELMNK
ncbi:MAG: hypothetical protein ICV84_15585 [Flavisolibacter sp.]|nr:hypothetical protein [Flavisolibacter sp.]